MRCCGAALAGGSCLDLDWSSFRAGQFRTNGHFEAEQSCVALHDPQGAVDGGEVLVPDSLLLGTEEQAVEVIGFHRAQHVYVIIEFCTVVGERGANVPASGLNQGLVGGMVLFLTIALDSIALLDKRSRQS